MLAKILLRMVPFLSIRTGTLKNKEPLPVLGLLLFYREDTSRIAVNDQQSIQNLISASKHCLFHSTATVMLLPVCIETVELPVSHMAPDTSTVASRDDE